MIDDFGLGSASSTLRYYADHRPETDNEYDTLAAELAYMASKLPRSP